MSDEPEVQAEAPAGGEIIDLDLPEQQEAPKEEGAKDEKSEPEAEVKPETEQADDDGEGDDKPRKRSGLQRLKARNSQLMQDLAARERELETLRSQSKTAGDPKDKEPVEADFNGDFFAYERAKTAWDVRKIIREENAANQTRSLDAQRQALIRDRQHAHNERVEAIKDTIKDYDAVVNSAPAITQDVAQEILASDKSELIAYHLAQHPEKISALNGMTGRELAREIGRLEGTVSAPSAKKHTTAPPPPSRVSGGAAPTSQDSVLNAWLKKTYG